MGYDSPASVVSINAVVAVRKGQIVKLSGTSVTPCAAAGEAFFGVALYDADADSLVAVCVSGECDVEVADASLAIGSLAQTDANGRAILVGSGDHVVGTMLEPGAAVISSRAAYRRIVIRLAPVVTA